MKKYDIGVLGVWFGRNYGSVLTYYALHEVLKSFGLSVLMVNRAIVKSELEQNPNLRFINEHYQISKPYEFSQIHQLNDICDTFIVGSDQIWHYNLISYFKRSDLLNFVSDNKRKISYGASFGHDMDFVPMGERNIIAHFMKQFDAISVREDDGVRICRDIYNIEAAHVLDPVFLLGIEKYIELSKNTQLNEKEPFILTYILDPDNSKREAILYAQKKLGYKSVNILDGGAIGRKYEGKKAALNLDGTLPAVQIEYLLYLYANSQFVITDSYHGTILSILFNKPFISIGNQLRGLSRINSLFKIVDFKERFTLDANEILNQERFFAPIDFTAANNILQKKRQNSLSWLKTALFSQRKEKVKVKESFFKHSLCAGCGACISACPTNALFWSADNDGFYVPDIDKEKCVNCGKCMKLCPVIYPSYKNTKTPKCYAFMADDEMRFKSSSGGVFGAIAYQFVQNGNLVCGAAWQKDISAAHIIADNINDLEKLHKSKYVQSFIGNTLKEVKDLLDKGKSVLFCGCPCQVAGLYAFLQKDYENLFTMDLLCANAPSPLHFKQYLNEIFGENNVLSYTFRSKIKGWGHTAIIETKDGKTYYENEYTDIFQRLYHPKCLTNASCEKCSFSTFPRQGDITIGDFWGISKRDGSLNDKKGTSVLLINNEKGEKLLQLAQKQAVLCKETPLQWLGGNGTMKGNKRDIPLQRNKFYTLSKTMPFLKAAIYALEYIPLDIDKQTILFRYYRYKVFSKILFGKKKRYYIEKRDKYHKYIRAFRSLKRKNNIKKAQMY